MRKPVQMALVAVVLLLAATTAVLFVRYRKTSADYADMKTQQEASQTRYGQTIEAIAEIQDSLNAISLGDTNVKMLSQQLASEQKLSAPNGKEALDQIAMLRASIMRNKDRIRQLESSLKANGNKIKGLTKMIAGLKESVSEKEALVADLTTRVESLQTQVTGLTTEVQETRDTLTVRDQTIEEKRRDAATVFVAVGDKKTLTQQGIITAKGGLLGMGKTIIPSSSVTPGTGAFVAIDTDQETVVKTDAKKAQVVSAQPASSYELREVDGKMELHILDPVAFRKIKQLVIMTA